MLKTAYREIPAYTTKDGSIIRELMHPAVHGGQSLSLAEATVPVGAVTILHRHEKAEEVYHVTCGEGEMILGGDRFAGIVGDTVRIPPGTPHRIRNTGAVDLKILCCCSPAYSHEDTKLTD